jgi:hypothetical protein
VLALLAVLSLSASPDVSAGDWVEYSYASSAHQRKSDHRRRGAVRLQVVFVSNNELQIKVNANLFEGVIALAPGGLKRPQPKGTPKRWETVALTCLETSYDEGQADGPVGSSCVTDDTRVALGNGRVSIKEQSTGPGGSGSRDLTLTGAGHAPVDGKRSETATRLNRDQPLDWAILQLPDERTR